MKILLFAPSLGSGGAERQLVTLGLLLKKHNVDVECLVYNDFPFYERVFIDNEIKVHKILHSSYFLRLLNIRRFVRKGNYSAVVSFLETPNFINCFCAVGGKTWKVITAERSAKESTFLSIKGKVFIWFQRYSDAIVCNSFNSKSMWLKYCPSYKSKLLVIYNTVNMLDFISSYTPKKNGKLNLVVAASYQFLKNPIGLINALILMSSEERSLFQINWYGAKDIGGGNTEAYDEASRLIKVHGLKSILILNHETRDIANKMVAADVVGLFSKVEGLPNAICEAMTLGKPIIMSRVSDYSVLVDGNGVLCEWENAISIKKSLLLLALASPNELINMGKLSRQKAKELFDKDIFLKKWLDVLES